MSNTNMQEGEGRLNRNNTPSFVEIFLPPLIVLGAASADKQPYQVFAMGRIIALQQDPRAMYE